MLRDSLAALVCLAAGAAIAQPAAKPTDPQIAKIVVTADQIDIDAAQLVGRLPWELV